MFLIYLEGQWGDFLPVPLDLDKKVTKLKLESMGVKVDNKLTPEQEEYLASWSEGT